MNTPKKKPQDNDQCSEESIDCAEKKLHTSIAKDHPEWVNEEGECDSCVSLEHELASDPTKIPEDV